MHPRMVVCQGLMEEKVLLQTSAFIPCIPKLTGSAPAGGTLHRETTVVCSRPCSQAFASDLLPSGSLPIVGRLASSSVQISHKLSSSKSPLEEAEAGAEGYPRGQEPFRMTLNSLQETSLGPACTLTSSEEWDLGWALNGLMPEEQTVRSERRNGIYRGQL